jgi:AhpD family alkylhydroperoxidase
MMNDWNSSRTALHAKVGEYAKLSPDTMRALFALDVAASKMGHLEPKVHELIALAVSVTTRCDGCIATHAKKAAEHCATREELA